MSISRSLGFAGLFALAAASPFLPRASADVVVSYYYASDNFGFERVNIPDIDQRRSTSPATPGLPGNGNTYCVPTATMNMMMYAANHGFPNIGPGPGVWQSPVEYNAATSAIQALGVTMNTNTAGGTGGAGWLAGMQAEFPAGDWVVTKYTANNSYAPSLEEMTQAAQGGSLVGFGYGRYDVIGEQDGTQIVDRDGGHAVTFAKSVASGPFGLVWVRDPASPNDGQTLTQSTFDNRLMVVTPKPVHISTSSRTMAALNYDPGATRHALIDQYITVRPAGFYGWQNYNLEVTVQFVQPFSLGDPSQSSLQEFQLDGNLAAMVIDPGQSNFIGLTDAPSPMLQVINMTNEEVTREIPAPAGTDKMTFGRHRDLYLATHNRVFCLDITKPDPVQVAVPLPWNPDALTYDDATDQVVLFNFERDQLALFDRGLPGAATIVQLSGLQSLAGSNASIAIDPTNGLYWVTSDADDAAYSIFFSAAGGPVVTRWIGPNLTSPAAVNINDAGQMFFSVPMTDPAGNVNYELIALEPSMGPPTGQFFNLVASANNAYAGFNLGANTLPLCSRTNFDPDTMVGPAWNHLQPEELNFGETIFTSHCSGDGGNQLGCTDCPCGNNAPQGTHGGCLNVSGASAELLSFGFPSISNDQLHFEVRRANPGTFGILISGADRAPNNPVNPCFGLETGVQSVYFNGLRCVVQGIQRHGTRATDEHGDIGSTNSGWGPPHGPPGGLIAQAGFAVGQQRHFQVVYREIPNESCGANLNTTQAISTRIMP